MRIRKATQGLLALALLCGVAGFGCKGTSGSNDLVQALSGDAGAKEGVADPEEPAVQQSSPHDSTVTQGGEGSVKPPPRQ